MHKIFPRENKKYLKINQNRACMYRIKPNKANEWPLMSTPINKAMLRIVGGNGNEAMRKLETRSLRWLYQECSLINPRVVSFSTVFSPSSIRQISPLFFLFFFALSFKPSSTLLLPSSFSTSFATPGLVKTKKKKKNLHPPTTTMARWSWLCHMSHACSSYRNRPPLPSIEMPNSPEVVKKNHLVHKRGLQICPSSVEFMSIRNMNTRMKIKSE